MSAALPPVAAVLGTAGHVDHGKTTLVYHLTGIDTDRLAEEKERGISIELGFAWLDLPAIQGAGPARVAVVDVPGHERFVRQMIAGAAGIDLVLLVVAADEGVMPQTREHLDICELLGVRAGAMVITKRDLVDAEWLELVRDDLRGATRGTFLEGAPIWTYAAGDAPDREALCLGIAELVQGLALGGGGGGKRADRPLKLSVDRVFTMKGFGTVATGTTSSGRLRAGDTVVVLPGGHQARVRGIEMHGTAVDEIGPGVRAAVNLQGLDHDQLGRGDVLSQPGGLAPTSMFEATFRALARLAEPVPDRARVLIHIGTSQVQGTLAFCGFDALRPGEEGVVQVRLDAPVAILPGEPFVARGFQVLAGYGKTLGGGRAWMPSLRRARGGGESHRELVRILSTGGPREQISAAAQHAEDQGLTRKSLAALLPLDRAAADAAVSELLAAGRVVEAAGRLYGAEVIDRLIERAGALLDELHKKAPARPGIRTDELRTRVRASASPELFAAVVARGVASGSLGARGECVSRPGFEPRRTPAQAALCQAVMVALRETELTPPRVQDLPEALGQSAEAVQEALDFLVDDALVVRITKELAYTREALESLEARLTAYLRAHDAMDTAVFKEMTGASRKWAIPLGEYFDQKRLTLRVGDLRRLRSRE